MVDDDALYRDYVADQLRGWGYFVVTATGGEEGLGVLSKNPEDWKAIVSDYRMPGTNGLKLLGYVVRNQIACSKLILMSSFLGEDLDLLRFRSEMNGESRLFYIEKDDLCALRLALGIVDAGEE